MDILTGREHPARLRSIDVTEASIWYLTTGSLNQIGAHRHPISMNQLAPPRKSNQPNINQPTFVEHETPVTYQGARNLMNTVFPAVSASQLSGVSSREAVAVAAMARRAKAVVFMVRFSVVLWRQFSERS
jgi:hypothetical protein